MPGYGASGFADAATDAEVEVDFRLFQSDPFPFLVPYLYGFKPNGLLRRGADLLADDAGRRVGEWQAPARVDHGKADSDLCLFLNRQLLDRSGGTYLTAEGAPVFAIADFRNQHGRPDPLQAGIEKSGLKTVGRANLHAFAAFYAPPEKFFFLQGARRTYEPRIHPRDFHKRRNPDERNGQNARQNGEGDVSPSQIECLRITLRGKPEAYGILRTRIVAIHTVEALRRFPAIAPIGNCTALAGRRASFTGVASLAHRPLQEGESRQKSQQRAERTKITAPESFLDEIESKNGKEKKTDQKALLEKRLLKGQEAFFEKRIEGFRNIHDYRRVKIIQNVEDGAGQIIEGRIETQGKRTDEQRQGIQNSRRLEGKERRRNDGQQDIIFCAEPSRMNDPFPALPKRRCDVVQRPQRTGPTAEYPAEKNRRDDENDGKIEGVRDGMGGKEIGERNKRVKIEEDPDGVTEFVSTL